MKTALATARWRAVLLAVLLLALGGDANDRRHPQMWWLSGDPNTQCQPWRVFATDLVTGETTEQTALSGTGITSAVGSDTLYWVHRQDPYKAATFVGRQSYDGTNRNATWAFVESGVYAMTVAPESGTLYLQEAGSYKFYRVTEDGTLVELGIYRGSGGGGMNGGVVVNESQGVGFFGAQGDSFNCPGVVTFDLTSNKSTPERDFNCHTGPYTAALKTLGPNNLGLLTTTDMNAFAAISATTGANVTRVPLPFKPRGWATPVDGSAAYVMSETAIYTASAPTYDDFVKITTFPDVVNATCTVGGLYVPVPLPPAEIVFISPTEGPVSGGTTVFVALADAAIPSAHWTCVFGKQRVRATLVAPRIASCQSPPAAKPGAVLFAVSAGGGVLSNEVVFTYRQ